MVVFINLVQQSQVLSKPFFKVSVDMPF